MAKNSKIIQLLLVQEIPENMTKCLELAPFLTEISIEYKGNHYVSYD